MKKLFTAVMLLSISMVFAQEETKSSSSLDLGVDIHSRYIWRGIQLGGNSASAQPWVDFSSGAFYIGAWGAYNLGGTGTGNEADLYLGYSFSDALSITVTDYFFQRKVILMDTGLIVVMCLKPCCHLQVQKVFQLEFLLPPILLEQMRT